ncbi:DUF4430 domain-containing protein [Rummeliibacillus suwonensis]|uniref:DUF4430 domain-containing protein n=1 Tax=Rummeliibacillus suwonensis TaxID=1306154 RepID=UPI00289C41D6|nr:DUF4430 domain-containing protein [Rummeliibacillus suwonensis]
MYQNKWIQRFIRLAAIVMAVSCLLFFFNRQDVKKYDDVLDSEATNVSKMPLSLSAVNGTITTNNSGNGGPNRHQSSDEEEDTKNTSDPDTKDQQQDSKKTNHSRSEQQRTQTKINNDPIDGQSKKDNSDLSAQQTDQGSGNHQKPSKKINTTDEAGKHQSKQADSKEIIAGEEDHNPYFTTSIQNGETVSQSKYYFSITQKNAKVKVLQTSIIVNDVTIKDFAGQVKLKQGKNTITIRVTYNDARTPNVERSYTVYYEENKLVIRTNLKEEKTNDQVIRFYANAYFNEQQFDVHVELDGEVLVQNDDGQYEASLRNGYNKFIITAKKDGEQVKKIIIMQYEKKKARIHFETDLKNQQVTSAELTFYATALVKGKAIPMTASLNGEMMEEKNDVYFDLLREGKNTVVLSAKSEGEIDKETYTIYYAEPTETSQETVPNDKNGPTIVTDLKNGTQVRGSIKNIIVRASDANGKRIQANGVSVKVNGQGVGFIWDDSEKTSYKLKLREGKNTIVIKAWDVEGRITTKTYTVYAKNVDEGKVIGQATISVEASTVGLKYLIKPTTIDIHEGEKGSYVLDQLLRKYGFTYQNTGTLDSNFYLARISKKGMSQNLRIPLDLAQLVKKSSSYYDETNYDPNSLGEFDIANGSGWMYSINGDYPNYGFSDAYFLDGDIIRIRYTLHYGSDINGSGVKGNNSNGASTTGGNGDAWGKEW